MGRLRLRWELARLYRLVIPTEITAGARRDLQAFNMGMSLPLSLLMVAQSLVSLVTCLLSPSEGASGVEAPAYLAILLVSLVTLLVLVAWHRSGRKDDPRAARASYAFALCVLSYGAAHSVFTTSEWVSSVTLMAGSMWAFLVLYLHPAFVIATSGIVFALVSTYNDMRFGGSEQGFPPMVMLWVTLVAVSMIHYNHGAGYYVERSKLQTANERLRQLSIIDPLTGLKNRLALRQDFEGYLNHEVSVLMIDINDFKEINDTLGHDAGDRVLERVGELIVTVFGTGGCYRYGGDEFVVVLRIDAKTMEGLQRHLRESLAQVRVEGGSPGVTASIGATSGTCTEAAELRGLIRLADQRMYVEKAERHGEKRTRRAERGVWRGGLWET